MNPGFASLSYILQWLSHEYENKMIWTPNRSHGFQVQNYYKALRSGDASPFPWRSTLKSKAQKVGFFNWTKPLRKIPTTNKLEKAWNNHSKLVMHL
jgi:hypothetical protein